MQSKKKSCRNCGSVELFAKEVIATGPYGPDLLPIGGIFNLPKFYLRICGGCGLAEWFVPSEYLAKVKEKFPREG
jgi:predicted nucleic-acid-binding Zn-ribbon protein